jgi:site-specific recombinase XerD
MISAENSSLLAGNRRKLALPAGKFTGKLMENNLQLIASEKIQILPPQTDAELSRSFILKSPSEETRRTYRNTLLEFGKFYEKRNSSPMNFSKVTYNDVQVWRDYLIKEGKRPHTISTKLAIIRSLFEYGRSLGVFERNPASAKLVPPPKKPKHSPGRALTPLEVKSLLSWFKLETLLGARDYALVLVMLRLSLRVSEVCNLKVSSIKWTSGRWVLVVKLKGGREELKPLPKDVKKAIDNYLALDRENRKTMKTNGVDAYLFQADPNKRWFGENNPLSTRHIWHLVKRYSKLVGIGDVSPHDLRRTAITQAFKRVCKKNCINCSNRQILISVKHSKN